MVSRRINIELAEFCDLCLVVSPQDEGKFRIPRFAKIDLPHGTTATSKYFLSRSEQPVRFSLSVGPGHFSRGPPKIA